MQIKSILNSNWLINKLIIGTNLKPREKGMTPRKGNVVVIELLSKSSQTDVSIWPREDCSIIDTDGRKEKAAKFH